MTLQASPINADDHRWSLVDKRGKTRLTCVTNTHAAAKVTFEAKRQSATPSGWTIVDRGPVEPKPIKVFMDPPAKAKKVADTLTVAGHPAVAPTPEPRAFKVGDEVRHKSCNPEEVGVIKRLLLASAFVVWPSAPDRPDGVMSPLKNLRHAEPAPQPKAEVKEDHHGLPLTGIVKAGNGTVIGAVYGEASEDPRWKVAARVKEQDAEIATLKAEVEDARLEAACERERAEAAERDARACAHERDAAKAQLSDMHALIVAGRILQALPGEPSIIDGMVSVLGRR